MEWTDARAGVGLGEVCGAVRLGPLSTWVTTPHLQLFRVPPPHTHTHTHTHRPSHVV